MQISRARMSLPVAVAIVATAHTGGCGSSAPGGSGPDGNPGGQVYRLVWGPVEVGPFQEDTRCLTVPLGNDIPVKIDRIRNTLGASSHHFIVYRVNDGDIGATPTPCVPFVDTLDPTAGAPLMITQRAEETLALPEGVAFALAADQLVRLEVHYVNPTPTPITVEAVTELHAMPDAEFRHEADFLFIGNPDIQLPSRPDVQQLGPTWFPVRSSLDGVEVFAITGHTHKLGVDVEVEVASGSDQPGTKVYDPVSFSWSEPETIFHDPPFTIPSGGGFRFTCQWINETGRFVDFGESADDEMCFFWAYYYPSRGSKVCVHSELYTQEPIDICCPDDEILCALINEYLGDNLPQ
jgi:hypothetical protein